MLQAIMTADIVNSRKQADSAWLKTLKRELKMVGSEPADWEIYRGDSFQLMTTAEDALHIALQIKAAIMQHKDLDIRLGIGIGEISHRAKKITESNGSAFARSGATFDALGKEHTLGIQSPWEDFDEVINIMLRLLGKLTSAWNINRAVILRESLRTPDLTQKELGQKLKKQQSNISNSLSKAGYDELREVLDYYKSQVLKRTKP